MQGYMNVKFDNYQFEIFGCMAFGDGNVSA